MEYIQVSVITEYDSFTNYDFTTTAEPVCFDSVELMVSGALFLPDQQTPLIDLQCEYGFACEVYKSLLLFRPGCVTLPNISG